MRYLSEGPAEPGGEAVYAVEDGVPEAALRSPSDDRVGVEALDPRTDLVNHSPSGFSWGYAGSGPAQLALAVLAHEYDEQFALDHYQDFKVMYVAEHPAEDRFVVTSALIEEIL